MVKVYLDPGHGGKDPGAVGNGIIEKHIALKISLQTRDVLSGNGFDVRMSRAGDSYPTLAQRAQDANSWGADVYVSIHVNASNGGYGYEDYIYNGMNRNSNTFKTTRRFQECVHNKVSGVWAKYGRRNRGMKMSNLQVLRETNMPAVLTENGFSNDVADTKLLKQDSFITELAIAHAQGIAAFFGKTIHVAAPPQQTSSSHNKNLYKVQIGAFRNRNNANNLLNKAKKEGFDAFIAVEGGLYKVQIGAYSVKENAVAQLNKAKRAGFSAFIA